MTRFTRSGHWRRGPYGDHHWVSEHQVWRDGWSSGFSSSATSSYPSYAHLARPSTYIECFVNPNAKCPVCHQPVFFYQNAFGSRVFFEDLGPPWPKHPCTDNGRPVAERSGPHQPRLLPHAQAAHLVRLWADHAKTRQIPVAPEGSWHLAKVTSLRTEGRATYFALAIHYGQLQRVIQAMCMGMPGWVRVGTWGYSDGYALSLLDPNELKPVTLAFKKLTSRR